MLEADLCKNQVIKDLLTPLLISFFEKNEIIVGNCGGNSVYLHII